MEERSLAFVSMISRTKNTTSSDDAVAASPRKSMSRCTTLAATSGNLTAQPWMACTSICLYSPPRSKSLFCVLTISFFSTITTSSMLRAVMRSMAMSSVFLRMSMLGDASARRMSISTSCMTSRCLFLSSVRRSSTMSLTLLSLWLTSSWQKQLAAARMADGAWDRDTSATAHSYTTAALLLCSRDRMILMYLPFSAGLLRHTLRMRSSTAICRISPHVDTISRCSNRNLTARSWAWVASMVNALRLVLRSCSLRSTFSIVSGASCSSSSPLGSL
mmetsp:Transcript_16619/g.41550  ORF Transcript_16619/g.41550 Transcript_16619/m.41550 type:complete len:275 (+) Transcript_16619:259-1083(+)